MQLDAIKGEQGAVQEVAAVFPGELAWQRDTGEVHQSVLWSAGLGIEDISPFWQHSERDPAGSSGSVLRKDVLSLARWMLPGLAQQSWPACPVTTVASGSATLGGKEKAGHGLKRLVAGWQAVLSMLSWL